MKYRVDVVSEPQEEPVTVDEALVHCRVDASSSSAELARIDAFIASARITLESLTRRAFVTRTLELAMDCFPTRFALPFPPLQSVVSIKYYDPSGVDTTLGADAYVVHVPTGPQAVRGFVDAKYGTRWPSIQPRPFGVRVQFVAGYGPAAAVPAPLREAIHVRVADRYENRGEETRAGITASERLVWPFIDFTGSVCG